MSHVHRNEYEEREHKQNADDKKVYILIETTLPLLYNYSNINSHYRNISVRTPAKEVEVCTCT